METPILVKTELLPIKDTPDSIKESFKKLEDIKDIAELLGISEIDLIFYTDEISPEHRYKTFEIPKRSGELRTISTPINELKVIQRKLNQILHSVYFPKPSVHGFALKKNIVTNAKAHSNKRYVLNLDLRDFFPCINFGRVQGMFMGKPYYVGKKAAKVLAKICCHDNALPQGAPTSPIITNMICAQMDSQFQYLAEKYKATYTRYADDITFSTTLPIFPRALAYRLTEQEGNKIVLGEPLLTIIKNNGFQVNDKKTRLQTKADHQEVTGLTVNKFPNVDRTYIRQIRAMLHAWAKYGLDMAELDHWKKYGSKEGISTIDKTQFRYRLRGKIEFVGMVRGKQDSIYQKLRQQYELYSKLFR